MDISYIYTIYIYTTSTPNLGFEIALSVRKKGAGPLERQQQESMGGATREHYRGA